MNCRRAQFLIFAVPILLALATTRASAQNPFSIDGTVLDAPGGNSHAVGDALKTIDPSGSSKELSPINGAGTKVGVIHKATLPVLGSTNQNPQVDLNAVWTDTEKAANGNLWYYFGWSRDSASGSGFISIEFQQNAAPAACDYANKTEAQLIAGCNPWANRKAGDFLLLWDQQGSSTTIIKRVFTGTAPNLTLGAGTIVSSAVATYSSDGFRGEAAVNLTTDVFGNSGACQTFANIIPNTVTGNSDTADYKDTVLKTFPPVTNCGTVTITKTTDPTGLSGTFTYTLAAGGTAIFGSGAGAVDTDCSVSGSNVTGQCRGTLTTSASQTSDTDTISNLLENDTNWTLGEDSPAPDFEIKSIDCTLGSTTWHLAGTGTLDAAFKVEAGQITACTIVNKLVKATPSQTTAQVGYAQVKDSISLTGIKAGASDASSATASFTLYSDSACTTSVGSAANVALVYANNGTTASATMSTTITIAPSLTYYWRVTYSGDNLNNTVTTPCSQESVTATFTFVGQ
jgi:hypothetical protein